MLFIHDHLECNIYLKKNPVGNALISPFCLCKTPVDVTSSAKFWWHLKSKNYSALSHKPCLVACPWGVGGRSCHPGWVWQGWWMCLKGTWLFLQQSGTVRMRCKSFWCGYFPSSGFGYSPACPTVGNFFSSGNTVLFGSAFSCFSK